MSRVLAPLGRLLIVAFFGMMDNAFDPQLLPGVEMYAHDPTLVLVCNGRSLVKTDPVVEDPVAMNPAAMDPAVADPAAMDPTVADPMAMDPTVADPVAMDPAVADSAAMAPTAVDTARKLLRFKGTPTIKVVR